MTSKQPKAKEFTFNGETHTIYGWAQKLNMSPQLMGQRIKKWGLEKAVTTPKRGFQYQGEQ